ILPGIREFLQTLKRRRPHTPLYSTVTGTVLSGREATDIAYWTRQLRDPVRFSDAGVAALRDLKPLFVELGPDGTCTQYLRQHGAGFRNRCFASFPHGGSRDEHRQYLHSAGSLWQAGCTLRWEAWHAG